MTLSVARERPIHPSSFGSVRKTGNGCRVVFVESYPHVMAGQQRTLLSLLEHCVRRRMKPLVAVPAPGPFVENATRLGVDVVLLDYPETLSVYGGAIYRYRGLRRLATVWQAAAYGLRLRKELKRLAISGMFCNDMRGLLTFGVAARSLGIPVMIWDKLDRPHGLLDWFQLPLANRTVFISEAVKQKFPRWQLRYYASRLSTVPNGARLEQLDSAAPARVELGVSDDSFAVGIVGTITKRKGHDRLFSVLPRLLEQVPNTVVLIVGAPETPADEEYLATLPHRDNHSVRLLGFRDDVPEILLSMDALVVPSRHEGMGQVVAEAMACRKPVVGARAGGIQEVVVHGETGLLFDGDNQQQLLDSLVTLARSPELRRKMGEAGRRRVEQYFNRPVQMQKVADLLSDLVTRRGKRYRS